MASLPRRRASSSGTPRRRPGHVYHMLQVLRTADRASCPTTLHMAGPTIKRTSRSYELLEHYKRIDGQKYADDAGRKWSFFNEMLKIKEFRRTAIVKGRGMGRPVLPLGRRGPPALTPTERARPWRQILKSLQGAQPLRERADTDVAFAKARRKEVDAASTRAATRSSSRSSKRSPPSARQATLDRYDDSAPRQRGGPRHRRRGPPDPARLHGAVRCSRAGNAAPRCLRGVDGATPRRVHLLLRGLLPRGNNLRELRCPP